MARKESAGAMKKPEGSFDSFLPPDYEINLDLHKRTDGINLDVDVERHGKWLEIDVDIGGLDFELKVQAGQLRPDVTPTAAQIGGEGNAVGESTLVDAEIFCRQIDFGAVTVAFGTATFKSVATVESENDLAFAAADTFASVSGADLVVVFNEKTSLSGRDGLSAIEVSKTSYIAVDFDDFDLASGPLVVQAADIDAYNRCLKELIGMTGNVATLDVDALAVGGNTLVDVAATVLTVENQLSSVSALVETSVG